MKKKFENRPIFDEVKAYKTKCASFLGHPIEKATREMSREYRQAFFYRILCVGKHGCQGEGNKAIFRGTELTFRVEGGTDHS